MDYRDFVIHIRAGGADEFDAFIESPAGEDNAKIRLARDIDQTLSMVQDVGRSITRSTAAAESENEQYRDVDWVSDGRAPSETVGEELFESLFSDHKARSLFDRSLGIVQGNGEGLRLKLRISLQDPGVARLANLPWELLHRDEYLNLSKDTPLVRYLNVQKPFELLPFNPPLRILVVVSDPDGAADLDLDKERQSIERTWGGKDGVEVDFLTQATMGELNKKLTERDYHVLHYMGHGHFDESRGVGVLVMEDEDGGVDSVDGGSLYVALRDARSIRLVFLNACDTAKSTRTQGEDPFAGVATALVSAGVPAVVAMQFPISDRAAILFAGSLYPSLAKGLPLDAAVAEARRKIRITHRESMEWATPVLFMRSPTGELFTDVDGGEEVVADEETPTARSTTESTSPAEAAAALSIAFASLYFLTAGFSAFISDQFIDFGKPIAFLTPMFTLGICIFGTQLRIQFPNARAGVFLQLSVCSIGIHGGQVFAALVATQLGDALWSEFTFITISGAAVLIVYSLLLGLHIRRVRGVQMGAMAASIVFAIGWTVALLNVDYAASQMKFEDLIQIANGGSAIAVSAVFWYASWRLRGLRY